LLKNSRIYIEPGGIQSEFAANVIKQMETTGGMLDDENLPILQKYVGGAQPTELSQIFIRPLKK